MWRTNDGAVRNCKLWWWRWWYWEEYSYVIYLEKLKINSCVKGQNKLNEAEYTDK